MRRRSLSENGMPERYLSMMLMLSSSVATVPSYMQGWVNSTSEAHAALVEIQRFSPVGNVIGLELHVRKGLTAYMRPT